MRRVPAWLAGAFVAFLTLGTLAAVALLSWFTFYSPFTAPPAVANMAFTATACPLSDALNTAP